MSSESKPTPEDAFESFFRLLRHFSVDENIHSLKETFEQNQRYKVSYHQNLEHLGGLQASVKEQTEQLATKEKEVNALTQQKKELDNTIANRQKELSTTRKEVAELLQKVKDKETRIKTLNDSLAGAKKTAEQLGATRKQLQETEQQLKSARGAVETFESFTLGKTTGTMNQQDMYDFFNTFNLQVA
jgi:chromosome segregation ATPase